MANSRENTGITITLEDLLLNGGLGPGASLSPAMLAKEIGTSHTPVREAISQLESEGLVERLPRLGARVRVIDRQELEELFELREMLEADAAAWAAKRISDRPDRRAAGTLRSVSKVDRAIPGRGRRADDAGAIAERLTLVNVAFHLDLINAAQNRWLRKIVDDLHVLAYLYLTFRTSPDDYPRISSRAKSRGGSPDADAAPLAMCAAWLWRGS